jgi:hypothetical protein
MKLNVLLAKRDHSKATFREQLVETAQYWVKNKGAEFLGIRKSYNPEGENPINYSHVGTQRMVTTVKKRLDYLAGHCSEYVTHQLNMEASNAQVARAPLVVDGKEICKLSAMELMTLKSILDNGELKNVYLHLPVREETRKWELSTDAEYKGGDLWQTAPIEGIDKTGESVNEILSDPNLKNLPDLAKYSPQVVQRKTERVLGTYKVEFFSSAYSFQQRAEMQERRSKLYAAVLEALAKCNEVEVVPSAFTGKQLFDYIHDGKI